LFGYILSLQKKSRQQEYILCLRTCFARDLGITSPCKSDIPQFKRRNLVPAAATCLDIDVTVCPTWMSSVLCNKSQYISIWSWLQYLATSILSCRNLIQTSWASVAGGQGLRTMSSVGARGSPCSSETGENNPSLADRVWCQAAIISCRKTSSCFGHAERSQSQHSTMSIITSARNSLTGPNAIVNHSLLGTVTFLLASRFTIKAVTFQMASWNLSIALASFESFSVSPPAAAVTVSTFFISFSAAAAAVSTFFISFSINFSHPRSPELSSSSSSSSSFARSNIPDTFPVYSFLWDKLAKNLLVSFLTQLLEDKLRTHSVARASPECVVVPSWPLLLMYSFMCDFIVSGAHFTAS